MRILRRLWKVLARLSGEEDYSRYCNHMRARHPDLRLPSEQEFYLSRLNEKYSRPNRCC
jgi:uncharacterized short protein YbdD (DUF466 family)